MIALASRQFDNLWRRYQWAIDHGYPASVNVLGLYRIWYALYLLVLNAVPDLRWMGSQPSLFYSPPPGLPLLWGTVLPEWVLVSIELAVIASVLMLLVGWKTPVASVAVCVVGLLANSVYFSFGKIDHTILTWMVPLAFAWSGWGEALSIDSHRKPAGASRYRQVAASRAIFASGVMLSVSFLTAAAPKIAGGWLSPNESAAQGHFLYLAEQLDRKDLLAEFFLSFNSRLVWEATDWATILLETTIAFTLLWPVMHRRVILAVWVFHVVNMLVLNIAFYVLLPVYVVFFLPLITDGQANRVLGFLRRHLWVGGVLVPSITAVAFLRQGIYQLILGDLVGLSSASREIVLIVVVLVVLVLLAAMTSGYRRPLPFSRQSAPRAAPVWLDD